MKIKLFIFTALFGALFMMQSCDEDEVFPEYPQEKLQFNQVLLLTSTAASDTALGIVPANKVWKIESFGGSTGAVVMGTLNGTPAGVLTKSINASGLYLHSWTLPVWLSEGTQLGFIDNSAGSLIWFSIVEYTIVP